MGSETKSHLLKAYRCCVRSCSNSRRDNPEKRFFTWPRDKERSALWIASLSMPIYKELRKISYKYSLVCEDHFSASSIKTSKGKIPARRMKSDAVPRLSVHCTPSNTPQEQLTNHETPIFQTSEENADTNYNPTTSDNASKHINIESSVVEISFPDTTNPTSVTKLLIMEQLPKTVVVLPASGTGERLGNSLPKQFAHVGGKQLYLWTVEVFQKLLWVQEIYLVVSADFFGDVSETIKSKPITYSNVRVVEGSYTRHRSIQAGLLEASERRHHTQAEIVIVHDVVRPCVSDNLCENVVRNALIYGACGPVRPLVSTIVAMDSEGLLQNAFPRKKLRASEMPQAFQFEVILKAYQEITEHELDEGTECLLLAKMYTKCRIKLLEWHEDLFKVTYERDLLSVEALIEKRMRNSEIN